MTIDQSPSELLHIPISHAFHGIAWHQVDEMFYGTLLQKGNALTDS